MVRSILTLFNGDDLIELFSIGRLYSTLTPGIMSQIVGCQTSYEAWTSLQKIFAASSKARIMQLRLEFQTGRKGGNSMMEYILKMKTDEY